jgi:hypothetical protein
MRRVMKLACLPEFTCSIFQIVLTKRFIRTNGKWRLVRVICLGSSFRVMILAGLSIFASSSTKEVSAVRLSRSLWV